MVFVPAGGSVVVFVKWLGLFISSAIRSVSGCLGSLSDGNVARLKFSLVLRDVSELRDLGAWNDLSLCVPVLLPRMYGCWLLRGTRVIGTRRARLSFCPSSLVVAASVNLKPVEAKSGRYLHVHGMPRTICGCMHASSTSVERRPGGGR